MNAAASIAHGGLTYDNAHKLVWGFDQSQNKRHLLGEEDKVPIRILIPICISDILRTFYRLHPFTRVRMYSKACAHVCDTVFRALMHSL